MLLFLLTELTHEDLFDEGFETDHEDCHAYTAKENLKIC